MIEKNFSELGFYVVADNSHDYVVDYVIYRIEAEDENGNLFFHRSGSGIYPDPVESIDDADMFAHGTVKWNGCSNWYFDEQDDVMLHGCTKKDLLDIGNILAACWDMTKELCPNWDNNND